MFGDTAWIFMRKFFLVGWFVSDGVWWKVDPLNMRCGRTFCQKVEGYVVLFRRQDKSGSTLRVKE